MIHLRDIDLPPSANNLYFNLGGAGRALSTSGKKYKTEMKAYLVQKFRTELLKAKKDVPYLLAVRFFFAELENTKTGKAKSRYKKLDTGNHLKLLEDVLKDVLGVDDSQNMVIVLLKDQKSATGTEHANVWLWNLEEEGTPFDGALGSLT